jgi:hypothetical protein
MGHPHDDKNDHRHHPHDHPQGLDPRGAVALDAVELVPPARSWTEPQLEETVAIFLRSYPTATANTVHRALGGRRSNILAAVRAVRPSAVPAVQASGRRGSNPVPVAGEPATEGGGDL